MSAQEFDVVVYGATGFTGKLVCEHLMRVYGAEARRLARRVAFEAARYLP